MGLLSLSPYSAASTLSELISDSTHIALFTSDPIAAGSMASEQPDADGYSRQAVSWTSSGGESEVTNALIEFEASGASWAGPWYIALVDSGTHGAGNVIAVMIDYDTGLPTTTFDMAGVSWVQDGNKLRIPSGELKFQVGEVPDRPPLDPVAEVLAMNPTLFWLFDRSEYNSVQLLYQDDAATTPVTSNGDPVGCAKDLVLGRDAIQSTSGRRPTYAAGVGIEFANNGELIPGDLSDVLPMTAAAPSTQDTDLYGYGVGWVTDSSGGNQCILNPSNSAAGMVTRNSLAAAVWGETTTAACTLADASYDDQRLDVYSNGCWARGLTYCAQSGGVVFRNAVSGTVPESVCFGNYQPGNNSYMMTGTISYAVFFDRLLSIPELAKLQQMLMKIGV